MLPTRGYATHGPKSKLEPFNFTRRELGPNDVLLQIEYCGICHSDIHQARGEWGNSTYPMVPGHEVTGHVTRVGPKVTKIQGWGFGWRWLLCGLVSNLLELQRGC
jgi:uncharacterized zinc-type alcohol dehydrogenase-like protein